MDLRTVLLKLNKITEDWSYDIDGRRQGYRDYSYDNLIVHEPSGDSYYTINGMNIEIYLRELRVLREQLRILLLTLKGQAMMIKFEKAQQQRLKSFESRKPDLTWEDDVLEDYDIESGEQWTSILHIPKCHKEISDAYDETYDCLSYTAGAYRDSIKLLSYALDPFYLERLRQGLILHNQISASTSKLQFESAFSGSSFGEFEPIRINVRASKPGFSNKIPLIYMIEKLAAQGKLVIPSVKGTTKEKSEIFSNVFCHYNGRKMTIAACENSYQTYMINSTKGKIYDTIKTIISNLDLIKGT